MSANLIINWITIVCMWIMWYNKTLLKHIWNRVYKMGISRLTAITIQNRDDLMVTSAGPTENGKYIGWITYPSSQNCRPLLNTESIFDTAELAEKHMQDLMLSLRSTQIS